MRVKSARRMLLAVVLLLAFACLAVEAAPGPTACLVAGVAGLHQLPDGSLTDKPLDDEHYLQLIVAARQRLAQTFGAPAARPVVVYFSRPDGFGPFTLNAFGSTQFLGARACVLIGPQGQNVDVVAHELMHAEIHERAGFWPRFR